MRRNITHIPLLAGLLMAASCSTNDDVGNVSGDYLKGADVVLSGNLPTATLQVEADCGWRITETTDWLTVSPVQGTGNATVELTAGVNPSSLEERSCPITVTTDGGVQRVITLSQSRSNESLAVSTTDLVFGENGGELSFTITSNTQWNISGGADWLTLSTTQGTENGTVSVTAQANSQETSRIAILTVSGNSTKFDIQVTEQGKNMVLVLEPELISATAKGATYTFQVMSNTDWTVTSDVTTWVEIPDASRNGSNEGRVSVTLADNITSEPRTANIRVTNTSGSVERTCVITQAGATVPTATQPAVTDITRYQANVSSTFTSSLAITACGFCYATQPNPTINDQSVSVAGVEGVSGEVATTLTGLTSGMTYHIRAWVRNANGIGYSSEAIFTTEGLIPDDDDIITPNL